jgi:hypothetical protein
MGSSRLTASVAAALCVVLTTVLALAVVIGGRDGAVRPGRGGAPRLESAEAVCQDLDEPDGAASTWSQSRLEPAARVAASAPPATIAAPAASVVSLTEVDGPPGTSSAFVSLSTSAQSGRAPPAL